MRPFTIKEIRMMAEEERVIELQKDIKKYGKVLEKHLSLDVVHALTNYIIAVNEYRQTETFKHYNQNNDEG
jgi:hypothetical protein